MKVGTRNLTAAKLKLRAALAAIAAANFGVVALAADTTWTGPAAGTWNVAANWNNGAPTAGNNTFVDNGAAGNADVTVTATATTGTLTISAGDRVTIANNVFLNLNGNGTTSFLINAGTVAINTGPSSSRLRFTNAATGVDATIGGGGTITMSGIASLDGTAGVRVVNLDNYIHGQGNIGQELITFTNHATVAADVTGGTLFIDPDAGSGTFSFMLNTGTLLATNGGILGLSGFNGGTFSNSGTIRAEDNSAVHLVTFASLFGGTLTTSGTGSIRVPTGENGFFTDVTNNGLCVSENNSDFGVSIGMVNNGTIRLEAGANATDFEIQNDVLLSGTGQLIMSGALAGINGADDRRLTNASGHTIRGQGSIGQFGIWVTNAGLITADVNGGTLTLSADGTAGANAFINTGTLRATNGGTLVLNGGEGQFTNTGGLIEAQTGSQVHFVNFASILGGGTMTSSGTGSLRVTAGQNAFFTNVTLNGLAVSENNSDFGVSSSLVNNGTISLESGLNATDFEIQTDVLLSGPGHLVMNGALAGINGADDRRLTNAAGHTIRGQGSIGQVTIWVTNNGLIAADVPAAALTLSADGTAGQNAFINTGRLIATNGGILSFSGAEGGFTSTGGTIEAQNASTVQFLNASIFGGTFVSTGSGEFRVPTGNAVALNDVTLNGTMIAENNSNIQTFGPLTNNGTIQINSGTNSTFLNVRAPTLLGGTGQLILSGTAAFAGGLNDQRLTNGPQHTIRGQGSVGGTEIWVTNNGTILADINGGSITLSGDGTAGANAVINDGTIRATNGAMTQFGPSEGGVSGLGTVTADANSSVQSVSGIGVNQGQVNGDGTFSVLGGSNFTATHYRVANMNVNASTAAVRAGGGTLGTSKVSNLSLVGTARLNLNNHDLAVDYTGSSVFSTIRAAIVTGYNNGAWNGVGINSSSAFASTSPKTALGYAEASQILGPGGGMFSGVAVDGTTVLVKYTVAGDANLSGGVNLDDFTALAANFGNAGVWTSGDFNYNGLVNLDDFTILAASFGLSLPPSDLPRGSAVPEPTAMLVLPALASLAARRRRR